jgi:hypothetical protein
VNGSSPRAVLDPASPQPFDDPQPRYYRVRPRRHRIAAALAVVALALGGGAVLLRGDLDGNAT